MPADRRPSRPCAQCGAALQHVPSAPGQRSSQAAAGFRRYRCVASKCGFEGWLPRRSRQAVGGILRRKRAAASQRWLLPALTALSVTAGLAALGVVAFRVLWLPAPPPPVRQSWVPGEHDDGRVLPMAHPLRRYVALQLQAESAAYLAQNPENGTAKAPADAPANAAAKAPERAQSNTPAKKPVQSTAPAAAQPAASAAVHVWPGGLKDSLTYRHGCVWGQPGRNPYKGTVEQALKASVLPPEVVQKIAQQVRMGSATDRVEISNSGIRAASSGRVFDASHFAMTYGMTLCTSTRVNFVPGHVEQASLYEASDNKGRVYAVMVPDVCGNVSVLGDAEDRRRVTSVAGSSDDAEATAKAEEANAPETGRAGGGPGVPGYVPGSGAGSGERDGLAGRTVAAVPGGALSGGSVGSFGGSFGGGSGGGAGSSAAGTTESTAASDSGSTSSGTSGSTSGGTSSGNPAAVAVAASGATPVDRVADAPSGAASAAGGTGAVETSVIASDTPRRMPDEIAWREPVNTTPTASDGPGQNNTVPEPGTLGMALLALGLMAGLARRRVTSPDVA